MMAIAASVSIILADLYMIWCCWMVWGRRWPVILLPMSSLVASVVSRIMIFLYYEDAIAKLFLTLYISLILATTLSCTLLIIYRIISVAGIKRGAIGRLGIYRRLIGVLLESSALYSTSLILYLAFTIRSDLKMLYFYVIASIAKGVAPTLLVGRAAAGHTRPRDDCDISIVSSLHFQPPSGPGTTSSQLADSTIQNAVPAMDIEAQPERGG
ncbi:hypothetical protein IW261DRAFT_1466913 [Armillaria novae-zelandiae]|uniref:Uncharacterized protein n=1 Tax=Armillaria novae-zelandiae TaxID=153914 RepID=A0AA39TDS6_9AGAR|nr:hypothetical protein IW261DRAFT_1466913 [Armillaria novae-zelandiae]